MSQRKGYTRSTVYEVGPNGRRLGDNQYAIIDLLYRTRLPIAREEVIRRLSVELGRTRQTIRSAIASLVAYDYIVLHEGTIVKVQIGIKETAQLDKRPQVAKKR
jgi:hypothetical protein